MKNKYSFIATSDSITVTGPKSLVVTVQKSAPNYVNLLATLKALKKDPGDPALEAIVEKHLDTKTSVEAWAKGNFKINGNTVTYKGTEVPVQIAKRMFAMAEKGENPISLMNFWEKLQKNPSWRSVEQLFPFLDHAGIPILPNGNFLAYKGVKSNYTDQHSGVVDNKPGVVNEMPRNKVSDDPNTPCHYGFHVGALSYARSFAAVTVVCEVDPTDVVAIPHDASQQKMRVCKYRVRGNHNGELLPSTTYILEEDIGEGTEIENDTSEEFEGIDPKAVTLAELELAKTQKVKAVTQHSKRTKKSLKEAKAAVDAALALFKAEAKVERETKAKTKKEPVEKRLKSQRSESKIVTIKVPKKFEAIHKMTMRQLLDQDIKTLREYATKVLSIVGVSKILGGKTNLVTRIVAVRKNFK